MRFLPKVVLFFLILSFFFFAEKQAIAQDAYPTSHPNTTPIPFPTSTPIPTPDCSRPNPEEYYTLFQPSIKSVLDNEWCMRENEKKSETVNIADQRTNHSSLLLTAINLTTDIIPFEKYAMPKASNTPNQPTARKTALEYLADAMDIVYQNPPASGIAYTKHMLANAGLLAKPAYAQGIGFVGLAPLLPIWTTMRNLAYVVIVIVMVVIGFMIIFRMKIDPKTVISVQMALPKIVVALILITFSYAIVGFMIDLMYLVMAIAISVFLNATGTYTAEEIVETQSNLMTGGLFQLGVYIFKGGLFEAGPAVLKNIFIETFGGSFAVSLISVIFLGWGALLGTIAIPAIIGVIIALGLLFTFIRLFLLLFNSYIQLIIAVIFGPLQLLTEAIPGKSAFGDWIRNIIANLVVFPATMMVIILSAYFATQSENKGMWMPPLIGVSDKSNTGLFNGILSLMILFIAPNLVASVKKMFKPKTGLPISMGTLVMPITGSTQTVMGAASNFYYMMNIRDMISRMGKGGGGSHGGHS